MAGWLWFVVYYMWRLRRRAAGRCTGPYTGAPVGAMYGPCRRRASGDAAVARVVVCTVARPLVRILARGGCGFCCRSRGGGVAAHGCAMTLVPPFQWYARWRTGKSFDFSGDMVVAIRWAAVQFVLRVRRPVLQMRSILVLSEVSCNSCFIEKHIPLHQL